MIANGYWVERKRLMWILGRGGEVCLSKGLFSGRTRHFGFFFDSMKTSWLTIVLLASTVIGTQAQIGSAIVPAGANLPLPTTYTVASRDANSRVWQRLTFQTSSSGQVVTNVHSYIELCTGLNFWSNGQWAASKEEIDILPNGTAAATNGQHQAYFPGDIYQGAIQLVTPDGRQLQSRPLGLSYDDGTNMVLIAELTNSIGYLAGSNQVVYPDSFTGLKADLRYTYTKAGFEQDIIVEESPLTPESYGLNPETARLQVLTEFFNPPQPAVTTTVLPAQAGTTLTDENLDFGVMKMIPGRAFLLGSDAHDAGALVSKSWVMLNGRQFLVEEVPVETLANQLAQLPGPQAASIKPYLNSVLHVVSAKRLLPAPRLAKTSPAGRFKQVAQVATPACGLVLDYVTMTTQTNYTFQGDSTYFLSGAVNLYRTNTFEGGAVLKYATNASLNVTEGQFPMKINWLASAYRPVVFTAKDDNSVGENITGSTGNPTNYYANPALQLVGPNTTPTISYFRIAYARQAVSLIGSSYNFYHGQIVNCQNGITINGLNSVWLRNVLFSSVQTNFNNLFHGTFDVQNSTFSSSSYLTTIKDTSGQGVYFYFTNCAFANVLNLTNSYSSSFVTYQLSGGYNGFYNTLELWGSPCTNNFYPFQSVGAGNYYLANGCNFTNAGTINIDSALLSALRQKTTHPPVVYPPTTISTNLTFSPQAQRDSNNCPDLGYHYDPIDYALGGVYVTNATVTVNPGTVIATYATNNITYGLGIGSGAQLLCQGLATNLNRIVQYNTVQEQAITNWSRVSSGSVESEFLNASPAATIFCRFTDWSMPAQDAPHLNATNGICNPISLQDCQFHGGKLVSSYPTINLTNCLFERVYASLWSADTNTPALRNNLFWRGIFDFAPNVTNALVKDNLFDQTTITNHSGIYTNYNGGYNAFVTSYNRLQPTNANDKILTNSPVYQNSWLGNYYLPTNSPLIKQGSTNANWVGLYHYTVTTNQVVEGTNVVSIGYHYVATDAYGNLLDSNGDGIPDYLEDANGNGVVDSGETNWGLAILTQPANQTAIQGSNVTFSVTAAGLSPLRYQWYFNSAVLTGATNAILPMSYVQTTNAGNYYVVVTNVAGSVTSSTAVLTVLVPPSITTQPTSQTVMLGTNATFSVTAEGTASLGYQWWFNGTNLLAGATNATITLTNVQATAAGGYSVVVTNMYGSVTSSNAVLIVRVANPMAAVGGEHIMDLTGDGDVISWGGNQYGELGDYTYLDSTNPVHVVGLTNLVKIASGLNHSLAIDSTGALWAWGDNQFAQLGDGVFNKTNLPVQVSGMTNSVIAVAGSQTMSIAAKADGTTWTWGITHYDSSEVSNNIPAQVEGLANVIAVAAGEDHFMVLSNDGTVWAWGGDSYGQLGEGIGGASYTPVQVLGLSNIVAICAGDNHSLALDTNGCVWAWGDNEYGQLGGGETDAATALPVIAFSNTVQIAAGANHSLALDTNGCVWAWGDNNAGQLGTNGFSMTNLPVHVVGLSNIISIAAGSDASVASAADGSVWQWGDSDGDGTNWVWGDETGSPALAPQYEDFYNGQLPCLPIVSGNSQTNYAGRESSVVFRVTATNGVSLSNAPVSVEVISGDMEIRTNTGGSNFKGLRLTTDTNGEVSLLCYVDINLSTNYGTIRILAASRERYVETNFLEILTTPPTVSFISPVDGSTNLIGTNQALPIVVAANAGFDDSIQEVDYFYQTNGGAITPLGTSSGGDFSFSWTNASWWSNDFVGEYTLSAVAVDNLGMQSSTQSVSVTVALDTYWFGIPDYLADTNGTLAAWQILYFGHLGLDPNGDYDNDGTNNLQEFINGTDPNKIRFSFSVPNQFVTTNVVDGIITVLRGVPSSLAVLVDNTNFAGATWTAYTLSNITVTIGTNQGEHDVWVGLRGLPTIAQQTWVETTLILDSTQPTISITNPSDGASLNASRVDVSGNFTAASLRQITVNGILAFVNGTSFEALNVPLDAATNVITAVIEDFTGTTNAASINVIGLTNSDGSMNDPVQLTGTPIAGFSPLAVTLNVVSNNAPGTFQQALYDFNGDGIIDFVTNNLDPVTITYTNGEYFPTVTIQTTAGLFSSSGGWNSSDPNRLQITVQSPVTILSTISVTDPVDLKWNGTNLYVLSGSSGTITEFDTNGTSINSLNNLGVNPTGFDVDSAGNIYVAVTSSNQVWKFIYTNSSYIADTNFGCCGFIGATNGATGTTNGQFNAPYDVAVSPDGGTISVSDSGNDRIQQFSAANGSFSAAFGTNGTDVGQFNTPKGLTYDASGTLYIVESNRISLVQGTFVTSTTGTNGTAFGQFSNALNINFGEHGVYVADTGNNRIQSFNSPVPHNPFSADPSVFRFAVTTNLNQPSVIAAKDDDLTTEKFYVADTGNNRVVLYTFASGDPTPAWISMTNHVIAGDISGALASFSIASVDDYRDLFLATGTSATISTISNIGALTPVYIDDDKAEYYFTQTINGQDLGVMVEFVKENGVWKILEF
ncbi:MAG: immunoglobulin domain-containing protein [Verrucomicrobiia bacterium]